MKKLLSNPLLYIFVLAFLLRVIGATYGFPFIFHPDEMTIINSAHGIKYNLNPDHFDWPHLYIYINFFIYITFEQIRMYLNYFGFKEFLSNIFPIFWDDGIASYFITRILTALFGAFTIFPVYLSGKNLFNKKVGILAALTFAVMPFHVWHSHYALADVPMIFFLCWSIYFCTKIFLENKYSSYIFAGLFVGLSASTKYNGGVCALLVFLSGLLYAYSKKARFLTLDSLKKLVVSGLFAVLGFFIGTPYALIDNQTFLRTDGPKGALWQFTNVGSIPLVEKPLRFLHEMIFALPQNFGYTIFIGFFIMTAILLVRIFKRKISKPSDYALILVTSMALIALWYVSGFEKTRAHYYLISYPFIALSFGFFVSMLIDKYAKRKYLILVLLFSLPLFYSLQGTVSFAAKDSRVVLYEWLRAESFPKNIPVVYNDQTLYKVLRKVGGFNLTDNPHRIKKYHLFFSGTADLKTDFPNLEMQNLTQIKEISPGYGKGPIIKVYLYDALK